MTRYLTYYSNRLGQWQIGYLDWAYIRYEDNDIEGMGIGYKGKANCGPYSKSFKDSLDESSGTWIEITAQLAAYLEGQVGPIMDCEAGEVFSKFMNPSKQVKSEPTKISQDSAATKYKNWRDDILRDIFGVK